MTLGFDGSRARRGQIKLKHGDETSIIKEQLMSELTKWIEENELKQAAAAEILRISRPRVSDVVNMKVQKFTIDALVQMVSRVGKKVRFAVR